MSDDFENRINAAAARAKAEQARKAEAADKQKTAEGKRVQLVKDAIDVWKGRIAPTIMQAIQTANQKLAESGIRLTANADNTHVLSAAGVGAAMPNLPFISISAVASGQRSPARSIAQKVASSRPRRIQAAEAPHLQIGLQVDATVVVTARHCTIRSRNPMPLSQLDEVEIKAIIADYVDAIIPAAK